MARPRPKPPTSKATTTAPLDPYKLSVTVGDPDRFKIIGKDGRLIWQANSGMQDRLFYWTNPHGEFCCDEILIGGPRGPGKSASAIAWAAALVHNGDYRGLVLRSSNEQMKEFIEAMAAVYEPMGAMRFGTPVSFRFPTGAIIWTGYLTDAASYEQYRGHEYHRIVIDEAQHVQKEKFYTILFGSNRSSKPGLKPQILLTANPDGPGAAFLKPRFIKVINNKTGEQIKPETPFFDTITKRWRIYIPGKLTDNKQLLENDPTFADRLMDPANPPHLIRAWVEGDWDAASGLFFEDFRPRKMLGEPKEALHVIPQYRLPNWCHRWLSLDWGFRHHAAVYLYAIGPDQRIHVEDELVVKSTGADELGAEIARMALPYLKEMRNPKLRCYTSPDAFTVRNKDNMIADQIAQGIQAILGKGSAINMEFTESERLQTDVNIALRMREDRLNRSKVGTNSIWLTAANDNRKAGWSFMRNLLRWRPLHITGKPNMEFAEKLLEKDGQLAYNAYLDQFERDSRPEILPRVFIHDNCTALAECIVKLIPNPKKLDDVLKFDSTDKEVGDDPADSFRYGIMGYKNHEHKVPEDVWVGMKIVENAKYCADQNDINLKIQIAMAAEKQYAEKFGKSNQQVYLPRDAVLLRRLVDK